MSNNRPHLIIMVGIPGSGKSFFADRFADTFKAPIISLGSLRYKISDTPSYSREEDKVVDKIADYMLNENLKTGRTIIYEGQADSRNERAILAKKARDAGYDPLFIWVQTEPLTAKKRSLKTPEGAHKMTPEQFDSKLHKFNTPLPSEKVVVISGKHTYTSQLKIVLKNLAEPRPTVAEPEPKACTERPQRSRSFLIR